MAFNPEELPPILQSSLLGLLAERQKPVGTSRQRRLKRGMLNAPPGNAFEPDIPGLGPRPALPKGPGPRYGGVMQAPPYIAPGGPARPNPLATLPPEAAPGAIEPQMDAENQVQPMPSPLNVPVDYLPDAYGDSSQQTGNPNTMLGMQGSPTPYSVPRETAPAALPAQPTSDDTWMAFLAAGLGILANNTGHYGAAGPAIGKGGLMGLQMFQQVRQNKQNEAYRQQQMKLHEQQLARQNAQMDIYRQQVQGQLESQQRANRGEQRMEDLLNIYRTAKPGSDEQNAARDEILLREKQFAQFTSATRPRTGSDKPVEEFVNDENGKPIVHDGQPLVKRWTKNPVTGEWTESYGYKSGLKVSTTVNMPGETAFSKSLGTKQGDLASEVNAQADLAANTKFSTDLMLDYAKRWKASGGQIGKMADIQGFTAGLLQAANINPEILGLPKDAGPQEAIRAISNRLTLSKIGGEGGMPANNFSDADRAFLQETASRAVDTPTGFVLKLMVERGASRRAMLKDEMLQDELDAAGDGKEQAAYRSFRSKWRKYVAANSAFTPEEKAEIDALVKELSNEGGPTQKPSGPVLPPGGYKATK